MYFYIQMKLQTGKLRYEFILAAPFETYEKKKYLSVTFVHQVFYSLFILV